MFTMRNNNAQMIIKWLSHSEGTFFYNKMTAVVVSIYFLSFSFLWVSFLLLDIVCTE